MTHFSLGFILAGVFVLGASFSDAQVPNFPVTTAANDESEPTVAQSPNNPNLLLCGWNSGYYSGKYYAYPMVASSTDGGYSWGSAASVLPSGYAKGFDPSLGIEAIENGYRYYYCFCAGQNIDAAGGAIFVSYSTDRSLWIPQAVSPTTVHQDKPFMTVDRTTSGRLYAAWTDFSNSTVTKIWCSKSTDGGLHWSSPPTLVQHWANPTQFNVIT